MSALAWWAIPVVATLLAIGYVSWASRPKPREDVHDSLKAHERFRAALERRPGERPGRRRGGRRAS